jgi:hypothetical protein
LEYFNYAVARFAEVDSVSGTLESSPGLKSPQNPQANPQVALANLHGATNHVPSFITLDGPVREARFVHSTTNPNDPDGGVHGLFTIQGRSDAHGCILPQPDFAGQLAKNNVIFRIPTPVFGLGLIENTSDFALIANLALNAPMKLALGIAGRFNTSANDGTIAHFGWKAQNKSLLMFAGEAYNVEQGVTNELFPTERSLVNGCGFNSTPEDSTNDSNLAGNAGQTSSDVTDFAAFMRLTAPPTATTASASELRGQAVFVTIGCAVCHSPTLVSGISPYTGMSNAIYHPYSDFAIHHMGQNLADGITQGIAGPDEFRSAPLWGLGQRLFFLHDGRTADLQQAIMDHAGPNSEADKVISNYQNLPPGAKQDLLNFLRSSRPCARPPSRSSKNPCTPYVGMPFSRKYRPSEAPVAIAGSVTTPGHMLSVTELNAFITSARIGDTGAAPSFSLMLTIT